MVTNISSTLLDNLWEELGNSCLGGTPLADGDVDPRLVLADLYEESGDSVISNGLRWAVRNGRSLVGRINNTTWFNLAEFSDGFHRDDVDNLPHYIFGAMTGYVSSSEDRTKRYATCRGAYEALCVALREVGET